MSASAEKIMNETLGIKPERELQAIQLTLSQGRKNLAFDFCFELTYPNSDQESIRECLQQYARYTKLAEQAFGNYVR